MPVEGINANQLEAFGKEYKASPKSFTLGLEAKTIWEGRGLGNLGKVSRWKLGGQTITKPTRDFSVQLGSWKEVGDAVGVEGSDDRLEPIETALLGLCSCVTEAIALNCARTGVNLEGLEATAQVEVDPGPIVGVSEPETWGNLTKAVRVDVTARGQFSAEDRKNVEDGAKRSPVHYMFSRGNLLDLTFNYER
jgi:uncharacterized OsmC-like protein